MHDKEPHRPDPRPPRPEPPSLAASAMGWLALPEQREALLGDAAEEFAERAARFGERTARLWYWKQVFRSAGPQLGERLRRTWREGESNKGTQPMTQWWNDVLFAFRTMRRRPLFAGTIVLTLGLGIGTTTALFGVFRAVFLEPLPLPDSNELVVVMETASLGCCGPASGPDYLDWVERQRSFDGMAVVRPNVGSVTGLEESERAYFAAVSPSVFDLLEVEPLLGRGLTYEDARMEVPQVVVLSHGFWQRSLGGRDDVVGRTLQVDGMPLTVVGVMPPGFDAPSPWTFTRAHQFYLPISDSSLLHNRGTLAFPVIARLADGVRVEEAQADMDRIMRELATQYPDTNAQRGAHVEPVHAYLYGDVGRQLFLILAAAGLVLMIACGNVASLLLARAAERESELTVRTALGASRRKLVRLLFTESLLYAVAGGALGVAVAFISLEGLQFILPPGIPRTDSIRLDTLPLLFAVGTALGTALLFGVLPALLASRTNLTDGLKAGGYGTLAPQKERMRDLFIVGQVALGLVLVNGGTLLVRNYLELRAEDQGFAREGVVTVAITANGPRYAVEEARLQFYDRIQESVAAVSGVRHVGLVSKLPLAGGTNSTVWVEGRPPRQNADEGPQVEVSSVSGDYFDAMGIPLLRGRTLVVADSATGSTGVIINRALAEEGWPGEDALGKRFSFSDDPPEWLTVVGIVGDVRQWGPERPALAEAYLPYARGRSTRAFVVARVTGDWRAAAGRIRQALLSVDPTQPPATVQNMADRLDNAFAERRFAMTLIGLFALAALLLAAAGIYGTVSYFVARRRRELGIRMALGADGGGVVRFVLRRGARLAVWGIAIGLVGVWASTSLIESLLYDMTATHVSTLTLGCVILVGVTLLASAVPAMKAVRLPPSLVLRAE